MTTSLKNLIDANSINISCDDISKLVIENNQTLTIILIRASFNKATIDTKIKHFNSLLSLELDYMDDLCYELAGEYIPNIIREMMDKPDLTFSQNISLHNMIDCILKAGMNDIINEILQIAYDTYMTSIEPPKFLIELLIHQNTNNNFRNTLLTMLLDSEPDSSSEPEYLSKHSKINILFFRIIELIIYNLRHTEDEEHIPNKDKDYMYMSQYDDICYMFIHNNNDELYECLYTIISDVITNYPQFIYFVKHMYCSFNDSIKQRFANNFIEYYSLLTSCSSWLASVDMIDRMDKFITVCFDDLRPVMIFKMILIVHGGLGYDILINNKNPYDRSRYTNHLCLNLFNIDAIDLMRKHFPDQFKKIITDNIFMKRLCIFKKANRINYNRKVMKILIKYTDYLNKLSLLPYDEMCNDYMIYVDPENTVNTNISDNTSSATMICSGCLMETYWILKNCNHSMCRECFVSHIYNKINIGNTIEECKSCTTCRDINTLKYMKYSDSDDDDDDSDDDSDD
jgi:hypothetical protein